MPSPPDSQRSAGVGPTQNERKERKKNGSKSCSLRRADKTDKTYLNSRGAKEAPCYKTVVLLGNKGLVLFGKSHRTFSKMLCMKE